MEREWSLKFRVSVLEDKVKSMRILLGIQSITILILALSILKHCLK